MCRSHGAASEGADHGQSTKLVSNFASTWPATQSVPDAIHPGAHTHRAASSHIFDPVPWGSQTPTAPPASSPEAGSAESPQPIELGTTVCEVRDRFFAVEDVLAHVVAAAARARGAESKQDDRACDRAST